MSEKECTELVSTFFTVRSSAFSLLDKTIHVRVNEVNPSIISLQVGGTEICTDRDNWAAIFRAFGDVVRSEVVEISLPGHTITVNTGERTAVLR